MANEPIIYKPQSAVMVRREMAKIPAVMDALGTVERAVFIASTEKNVAEYDASGLAMELSTSLKWICKDVGYKSTDESERQYLVIRIAEILKRYYPGMSLKDFRIAFEMCIAGELDDYLPKGRDGMPDRGHYQQFNAEYVCKILNAYRVRRDAILRKAFEAAPTTEQRIDPKREMEFRNDVRKQCIDAYRFFKENDKMPNLSPIGEMLIYDALVDVGLAKEIVVTEDEQRIIFERTIEEYFRDGAVFDAKRLQQAGPASPELQTGAYKLARRKALQSVFERMSKEDVNITDYIKLEEWK